ncbi:MAG TPA: acetyl-CoA hydrolase/transferase C-terminal domain-containing protein [Caulobacteraceae bacterium]|jgi:acyl-CoA hydrolase|nr:acetyl-CoA hydrolase/transferase C-terminal domain-containing protein [Caulobacteraceae bacterium]
MSGAERDALERLRAALDGARLIYLQAGVGEPLALRGLLAASPGLLEGRTIVSCLLPGMNEFDYAALSPHARVETFLLPAASRASFEAGRVRVRPLPYSQIADWLAQGPAPDLAIVQTSLPDAAGRASLGPCADFAPIVAPRARARLAFVNAAWPATATGPALDAASLDVTIRFDGPFVTAGPEREDLVLESIGRSVAGLIPDGAAIQTGIGGAPARALFALCARRGLRVRSGMVTPGYQALDEAGALDPDAEHVTGMALGPEAFMQWAAGRFVFADARRTHGAAGLAATKALHTINSALEVDLFGQTNLEWRGGRLYSGLGGAPDFARAARRSPGGRAILALPATARGGASRIVARLAAPSVGLARDDADLVVTEFGVADLRGADLDERAARLTAIAAPAHRAPLAAAWREVRRSL